MFVYILVPIMKNRTGDAVVIAVIAVHQMFPFFNFYVSIENAYHT